MHTPGGRYGSFRRSVRILPAVFPVGDMDPSGERYESFRLAVYILPMCGGYLSGQRRQRARQKLWWDGVAKPRHGDADDRRGLRRTFQRPACRQG